MKMNGKIRLIKCWLLLIPVNVLNYLAALVVIALGSPYWAYLHILEGREEMTREIEEEKPYNPFDN